MPGPAGTGGQQSGTAAGGPGIGEPLSVWPASPAPGPAPGPGPEAAHVITEFSRPGELVVIPAAGTGALMSAAAAAGRRVLGLFPGPAACHAASSRLDQDLGPARRPLAQVRAGGPDVLLEAGCPEAVQAALAITGRGGPGGSVLYAACERVLRPGGVLAAITGGQLTPGPPGAARPDEAAGPPAVHARVHSDLLVFTKPGKPASSAALKGSQPEPGGPMR
jgi:hypothetical protein